MNRRPLVWLCIGLMLAIWGCRLLGIPIFGEPRLSDPVRGALEAGQYTTVTGTVRDRQLKENSIQYILSDSTARVSGENIHLSKLNMTILPDAAVHPSFELQRSDVPDSYSACEIPLGSVLSVSGKLSLMEGATNPGQFDSREYYASRKIYTGIFAEEVTMMTAGGGWKEWLRSRREKLADCFRSVMHPDQAGILTAMLLGDKSLLSDETNLNWRYSGISHMLAISGLHITILGMGFYRLLLHLLLAISRMKKKRILLLLAACVSALMMGVYCFFIGMPISAARAWTMFLILLLARIFRRSYDSLCTLAAAAIVLLLSNPGYLFSAGFQLSFAAVIGAAILYPYLLSLLPRNFWKKRERRNRRLEKVLESIIGWASIMLLTLPMISFYFYEIPVYGLPANLLLVPVMGILLVVGLAGGSICLLSMRAGSWLLFPVDLILGWIGKGAEWMQQLPGAVRVFGQPAWLQVFLYYLLLAICVFILKQERGRKAAASEQGSEKTEEGQRKRRKLQGQMKGATGYRESAEVGSSDGQGRKTAECSGISDERRKIYMGALCCVLMLTAIMLLFIRPGKGFALTMLDVGQGDSLVIRTEAGGIFLLDGGSSNVKKVGRYRILPYLKQQGISYIEGIFVTHGDADHYNGITELLEAMQKEETVIRAGSLLLPVTMQGTYEAEVLMEYCREIGISVRYLAAGDVIGSGETEIRVLYPFITEAEDNSTAVSGAAPGIQGIEEGLGPEGFAVAPGVRMTGSKPDSIAFEAEVSRAVWVYVRNVICSDGLYADKSPGVDAYTNKSSKNEDSLVLEINNDGYRFLLTGDLEGSGEEAVLPYLRKIDVLKAAHHGSEYSTSAVFLDRTKPELTLISAPRNSRYGHPHAAMLERLEECGSQYLITRDSGAITVKERDGEVIVSVWLSGQQLCYNSSSDSERTG